MFARQAARNLTQAVSRRNFSTTLRRRGGDKQEEGIPGSTLPFDCSNPYKMMGVITFWTSFATGLSFWMMRRCLLIENQ